MIWLLLLAPSLAALVFVIGPMRGHWPPWRGWGARPCEFCKQVRHRVRCQGCCRDICARCMAVPNCDHDENGIHQEGGA